MAYKENLSKLQEKNSQILKLKKEIKEISSGLFDQFRDYIFNKYSELESFGWVQFTPYFNDGDTCVFYADTNYLKINNETAEESEWFSPITITNYGTWNNQLRKYENRTEETNKNYNQVLIDAYNEITDFLSNFDDDFYLSKFGDHAEITVTKSGLDISDYDHD